MYSDIFGTDGDQIPMGATIGSAILTIHISNISRGLHTVHKVLTAWDETTVTWNSFNPSNPVGIAGTDWDASIVDSFTPSVIGLYTIDVTSTVQAWASGLDSNFGWIILNLNSDASIFDTEDHSTLANRPLLTVTFNEATIPEPMTVSMLVTSILGLVLRIKRRV